MSNTNLYLNPAYAGYEKNTSFNINHKSQWKAFGLPYSVSYVSIVKPFFSDKLAEIPFWGIGANVIQERFEDAGYQLINANISGAYNLFQFDEINSLQFGIQLGMTQRSINASSLQWGSQFEKFNGFDKTFPADPIAGNIATSKWIPEVSSGIIYSYNAHRQDIRSHGSDFTIGYAAYHLNRADQSFFSGIKSPTKFSHKSFLYFNKSLPPFFYLSPGIITSVQGDRFYFQTGMDVRYLLVQKEKVLIPDQLMAGCWFQNNGFISYMLGIRNDNWSAGFNYDMVLGRKKEFFGLSSGWEIFFRIEIDREIIYERHPPADRPL